MPFDEEDGILSKSLYRLKAEQEGYLLQTDRASAFMIDHSEIFLTFCLITMQNLVVVYDTMRTQEIPKPWRTPSPCPLLNGAWLTPEKHVAPPHVLSYQIASL